MATADSFSMTPYFTHAASFPRKRRHLCAAEHKGGGEYGKEGICAIKMQKQNVFYDFIAAAEWLICQQIYRQRISQ